MLDNDVQRKTHAVAWLYHSRGDSYTAKRVSACGYGNRCRERHCPICEHTRALDRFHKVNNTYTQLHNEHPRMQEPQIVTMTTANTPIAFVGSTVDALNATSSMALSSTSAYAFYRQIEVVPADVGITHANVHAHALLFLPQRQIVTAEELYTTWSQAVSSTDSPITLRDLTLEPPHSDFLAAFEYSTKAEQPLKLLADPDTGAFNPTFFNSYSDQTAGKHMHRLARFHDLP